MRYSVVAAVLLFVYGMRLPAGASDIGGILPVTVRDARTDMPVTRARICISTDSLCRESDASGNSTFSDLPPGHYEVTVSAEGYVAATERNVIVRTGLNYRLVIVIDKSSIVDLEKMTVTAMKFIREKPSQSTSTTRITPFELTHTAGTADDISRVIAANPAVVSAAGAVDDNSLFVRGGGSNENVFIIDGIELENANHFSSVDQSGGGISFLPGTLVRELDFYAGGFPASLPPRLSAVIDMQLRTGSFTDYSMEVDANMAGLGFTCEGPVSRRLSFLSSMRIVDLRFLDGYLELNGLPRFGDGALKLVFAPNDRHTLRVLGLGAVDNYHEQNNYNRFPISYDGWTYQGGGVADWTWGTEKMRNVFSVTGSARKENRYDEALYADDATRIDTSKVNLSEYQRSETIIDSLLLPTDTMQLVISGYAGKRLMEETDLRWRATVKDQFTLFFRDNDQLSMGCTFSSSKFWISNERAARGEVVLLFSENGKQVRECPYSWKAFSVDSSITVRHAGGYMEYVLNEGWIKMVAGFRGDYYTVLTDYGISPRCGVQLTTRSLGTFSVSGGLYYQFPSEFSGMIGSIIAENPNYYDAVNAPLGDARLQRNWQGVFRYERSIGECHGLTLETYCKWYDREYPFKSADERRYNEYSDGTLHWLLNKANGKKRAYGMETVFRKNSFDRIYYICSYSLFRVENRYVNRKWYPDEKSLGNMFGLTLGSNFARSHGISLRLAVSGGERYSPIRKRETGNGFEYDPTKDFYREQLDPMVSANLRYSFTLNRSWGNITGYLELWNLLDYTPVIERSLGESGYWDYEPNGILPIAGVKVSF